MKRICMLLLLSVLVCLLAACHQSHDFGPWETVKDPTCTEEGLKERKCECGETESKKVNPKGHSFGSWTITKEATCTQEGTKERSCVCGETETAKMNATGHSFSRWTVVNQPTCTGSGQEKRTCQCGETETRAITATGHSWKKATCTEPKTCTSCGTTDGKALGHTSNGKGYCSTCGDKLTIDMKTVVGSPNDCSTTAALGGFSFYKNSANGIKMLWGGKNNSGKTINYYSLTFYFYNSVGDPAYDEITGKNYKTIKYVGPVEPGKDLICYSIIGYVPVCSKVVLGEITIEYADGTVDTGWYGWYTTKKNSLLK